MQIKFLSSIRTNYFNQFTFSYYNERQIVSSNSFILMGSLIFNDFLAAMVAKVTSTDSSKLIEK